MKKQYRHLSSTLVAVMFACGAHAAPTTFKDDFSGYREGTPPARNWFTQGGWTVQRGAIICGDVRQALAVPADVPYGTAATLEAKVTPLGATGSNWKTAGLAVYWDAKNYWLLCLTEFPGKEDGAKHLIELNAMVDGVWQANTQGNTKLDEWPPLQGATWRTGETYAMRLTTTSEGIRATIADSTGKRIYERGYRFKDDVKAVRAGVPVLWNQSFNTRFDDVAIIVDGAVAPPEEVLNLRKPIPAPRIADAGSDYAFRDDFDKTADERALMAPWYATSRYWETKGKAMRSADGGRVHATVDGAPIGTAVRVEADVVVSQSLGGSWKQAGVAVAKAPNEYWLLCLTEEPGKHAGAKHMIELSEMLPGNNWQAQNREGTKLEVVESRSFAQWSKSAQYKMRLEMTPELIEGTVFGAQGEVVFHGLYRFKEGVEAVWEGTPILWNQGFDCSFDNVAFAVAGAKAGTPFAQVRPKEDFAAYKARPYTAAPMGGKLVDAAPGFFGLAEKDGVHWFVDPNGHAYYSVGVEQVKYSGHFSPALGYSPYNRNILAKYGTVQKWSEATSARLREWGFNTASVMPYTIAPGGGEAFLDGVAVTMIANIGQSFVAYSDLSPITINGFPNVFHPRWQEHCDAKAREFCSRFRDNPWILGYYIDNELDWHGSNCAAFFIHTNASGDGPLEYGLMLDILRKPADHSARIAFLDFLRKRHGDIAKLNAVWKTNFAGFDAIEADEVFILGNPVPGSHPDMREFLRIIADRYYGATSSAIRKADPNHLILGTRFAGWSQDPVWEMCGKYCDVVSVNHYPFVELDEGTVNSAREMLQRVVKLCKRPILLSEWSFVSLDSGLPCQHGAGERFDTEAQRARAFQIYQSMMFETPFCIGSDYFMWADQPAGGMQSASNPEDCSYGLVKENDEPYPLLVKAATEINRLAVPLHAQAVPMLHFNGADLVVEDRCETPRKAVVEMWCNGTKREIPLTLGGRRGDHRLLIWNDIKGPEASVIFAMARITVEGLPSTDRQSAFVETIWHAPVLAEKAVRTVTVVNPAGMAIKNYLAEIELDDGKPVRAVGLEDGVAPLQQIEEENGKRTLLVLVDELPPRGAKAFRIEASADANILRPGEIALPFAYDNGVIRIEKRDRSAKMLDAVSLGDLKLGELGSLLWQKTPQNQFLKPIRLVGFKGIVGPVRTTLHYDLALPDGVSANGLPEVGRDGKAIPASPGLPPAVGAFRVEYRVRLQKGVPFYTTQFRGIENLADFPWTLDRYYHYMSSFIGGDKANDTAENGQVVTEYYNPSLLWHDAEANAGYGVVRPRGMFGSNFSVDESGNQHPDLCRLVRVRLDPGESWKCPDELDVPIFGCRGSLADKPWEAIARDIQARGAVRVCNRFCH